ncbi:hypothetical protein J3E68DRAFT_403197 [Trichoderma sp. SZMC 28012]
MILVNLGLCLQKRESSACSARVLLLSLSLVSISLAGSRFGAGAARSHFHFFPFFPSVSANPSCGSQLKFAVRARAGGTYLAVPGSTWPCT